MDLYIILGYLGSGKTTFIKNFLNETDKKTALIVNDFGQSDVDGILLSKHSKILKSITNGSIFCSCRSDMFVSACIEVAKCTPDIILVEASGMANPSSLFSVTDILMDKIPNLNIRGVITLIDVSTVEKIISSCVTVKNQIAFADLLIFNKCDLVSKLDIERLVVLARDYNQSAKIVYATNASVPKNVLPIKPISDKKTLPDIAEINTKKYKLTTANIYDYDNLLNMCKIWSEVAHRIKGIIRMENKTYAFQYSSSKGELLELDHESAESYIIVLAITKTNLKKILSDSLTLDVNGLTLEQ